MHTFLWISFIHFHLRSICLVIFEHSVDFVISQRRHPGGSRRIVSVTVEENCMLSMFKDRNFP